MTAIAPRITLLIHSLNGGGAERQIVSLANHLSRHGFMCTLITLDSEVNDRCIVDSTVTRIGLNAMKASRSLLGALTENQKRIRLVREVVGQSQADCVVSFCDKMNVITLAACRSLSIPVVISERSDPRRQKLGWFWEAGRRWFYPTCTACVVQTGGVGEYLRSILGKHKSLEVIPSAIDMPTMTIPTQDDRTDRPSRLLYVGRLSSEKGLDRLIQAWSSVAGKHPHWKLTIIGDGPLESSLKVFCQNLSLQDRVEFLGWKNDVWPTLISAHAFVLPSLYEGFPGALLEAMYAGLPLVATDCSDSICELIEHERNGLIAKNSLKSLTSEMDRLLGDARLREQLGSAARETANHYRWSEMISRWIRVIEKSIVESQA